MGMACKYMSEIGMEFTLSVRRDNEITLSTATGAEVRLFDAKDGVQYCGRMYMNGHPAYIGISNSYMSRNGGQPLDPGSVITKCLDVITVLLRFDKMHDIHVTALYKRTLNIGMHALRIPDNTRTGTGIHNLVLVKRRLRNEIVREASRLVEQYNPSHQRKVSVDDYQVLIHAFLTACPSG